MYSKLTAPFKDRLFAGIVFFITFFLSVIPIYLQFGKPFSLQLFFVTLIWLMLAGIAFFFFLQTMVSPKVQVYDRFVIITGLKRIVLKRDAIKECSYQNGELIISYSENGKTLSISVKVKEDPSEIIRQLRAL